MKNFSEYLQESLLRHIALELKDLDPIYEKYGEYDGCKELSNYIENKCKEKDKECNFIIKFDEVKNISNIVFDELEIKLIKDDFIHANYNIEETKPICDTGRFEYCTITLFFKIHSYGASFNSIIEHELTHLFNDFKLQQKGLISFLELFKNDEIYKKSKEFILRKPLEKREIDKALYLLNEYEKNAFISQLMNEIREIKKSYSNNEINSIKMLNMIQSLDIYKAYMEIGDLILRYDNNNLTNKEKENIIEEWKYIYHKDENLYSIFKQLKRKFIKTKNKIETLIPKKIAESVGYNGLDYRINLKDLLFS